MTFKNIKQSSVNILSLFLQQAINIEMMLIDIKRNFKEIFGYYK